MKRILYCILTVVMGVACFTACKGEDESSSSVVESTQSTESVATGDEIQITPNEVVLSVGETVQLTATTEKGNVYLFWSVRDEGVATVSDEGVVTGVAEGQTICYASYGKESAMCLVKVLAEKAKPILSIDTPYTNYAEGVKLFVGDSFDLNITVKLGDDVCGEAQVTYAVADAAIAEEEGGQLVALAVGETMVTVTATYDGQTATLTLPISVVARLA